MSQSQVIFWQLDWRKLLKQLGDPRTLMTSWLQRWRLSQTMTGDGLFERVLLQLFGFLRWLCVVRSLHLTQRVAAECVRRVLHVLSAKGKQSRHTEMPKTWKPEQNMTPLPWPAKHLENCWLTISKERKSGKVYRNAHIHFLHLSTRGTSVSWITTEQDGERYMPSSYRFINYVNYVFIGI